jgi:hypothetical protein
VDLLDVPDRRRRESFRASFADYLSANPSKRLFQKLVDLALADVAADALLSACELRSIWRDNPRWWFVRSRGYHQPYQARSGGSLLTWPKALAICECSDGVPVEALIEDDWLDDWWALSYPSPGYWGFVDYCVERCRVGPEANIRLFATNRSAHAGALRQIVNNYSRTGNLVRGHTDEWVRTSQ